MLITIGAFDGFHKGHSELFRLCREHAGKNWAVITFWPHPAQHPHTLLHALRHTLFTLNERELLRKILDIPNMYILEFNDELKNLSPSEFWKLCRRRFNADGLVIGSDFHFGLNRAGNAEYLCRLAKHDGVNKIFIANLKDKPIFSSSRVRAEIESGKVEDAAKILGYPYFIIGSIIHGSQRGRTMKFPTANLDIHNRIIPAYGVYSSAVLIGGKWYCGAVSIGNNPTFHDISETRFEVHILGFNGDIYDAEMPVLLLGRVREMITFPDKNALIERIKLDTVLCRKIYEDAVNNYEVQKFLSDFREIYCSGKINPEIIRLV